MTNDTATAKLYCTKKRKSIQLLAIMSSDSNYAAVTRHRRPLNAKSGRPPVLELVDDDWAADKLSDDEVDVGRHEADAGGFEEGELDADAIVVSPAGNSASAANSGM